MGVYWIRQGEEAETDDTRGDCRKQSKAVTANDNEFAPEMRLAA